MARAVKAAGAAEQEAAEAVKPAARAAKTAAKKTAGKTTAKKAASPASRAAKSRATHNLVIVESPAKAKTIQNYLGKGYEVIASMGHVRDLPKSTMGVDVENHFQPKYINIRGKEELIKKLKSEAKNAKTVYLATDPDREGEAISWHLANMLGLDLQDTNRVTFNEITKTGVKNGMAHPRSINLDLVNAQQTRRILDRIVGYKLSPFLWKKVKSGLSAGRVQSVVVRLIVDREEEIRAFQVEEYWTIDARLMVKGARKPFSARLFSKDGEKLEIRTEAEAQAVLQALEGLDYTVSGLKKGVREKTPAPPFITSTLQQDASRKLGFQARRTMRAAQELYEGVDVEGLGTVGLITYMRTDSLRVADEAVAAAREFVQGRYGERYVYPGKRNYKTRGNAQDGHEAIRPTMPSVTPDQVKASLSADQYKLYKLIWERFMASFMPNAVYDTVAAEISAGPYLFKASGYTVRFDGFTILYEEGRDEKEEDGGALPPLEQGNALTAQAVEPNQHFTQPPARYTEASLIKELESNGIGRPSTYAPTISTVVNRTYVEREGKSLKPTPLGEIVTRLMREQFAHIVDVDFTAKMEDDLDQIEDGRAQWVDTLEDFYSDFSKTLEKAEEQMGDTRVEVPVEETDVVCERCGRNMVVKTGRFGKFLACPGFPECRNTKRIVQETGGICPLCGGRVLAKKSKKGKGYYGCEHNPGCSFMTWDKPLTDLCPKCGSTLYKKPGRGGGVHCLKPDCGYEK